VKALGEPIAENLPHQLSILLAVLFYSDDQSSQGSESDQYDEGKLMPACLVSIKRRVNNLIYIYNLRLIL